MTTSVLTNPTSATPTAATAADRRSTGRITRTAMVLIAAAVSMVALSTSDAHAASWGYAECSGTYFEGAITIHPGYVAAGTVATEYLYVASNGQWVWTGRKASATSFGNGYWNTTSNAISFSPLPYHRAYYAVFEVLTYGGRTLGTGWYNSYDNGAFSSPRYTSSCWFG